MVDHSREAQLSVALALIHFAFRKIIKEPDRLLAKRGLGRVHHRLLFFVARKPGLSVGDLLAILDVSKQSLHRPMQDLLQRGMLEALADPANRRVKRLHLTPRGRAFEAKLSGIQRRLFARAFEAHGPAAEREWRAIMDDLGGGRAEAVLPPAGALGIVGHVRAPGHVAGPSVRTATAGRRRSDGRRL